MTTHEDVGELIARARALADDEDEDEAYWEIVRDLQRRGDRETFDVARVLCNDDSDDARCLGIAVLARLGVGDARPFLEETLPLLLALCTPAASDDLLAASIQALGQLHDPRGAAAVIAQGGHPDATVRLAVAQSAEGVAGEPPAAAVVDTVIELTHDDDRDVRSWATFSLALLFEVDDAAVREALHARVADPDAVISAEAIAGLAARRDARAPGLVLDRLSAAIEGGFAEPAIAETMVDAAELLADPRLIPALATLRAQEDDPDWCERLTEVIAACSEPA